MKKHLLVAVAVIASTAAPALVTAADDLKVVLLGTGVGPPVNLRQYGASTLVEAGGRRFLFDCGRGATMRLAQAGIPLGTVTQVFLTHLHSDHVIQLPDLLLAGWGGGQRAVPLKIWGPTGTRAMMAHLQQAFDFDIRMRRDVVEHLNPAGIQVVSREVTTDGVVFAERGVTVTAFLVDHGPVAPAFGYRVDYGEHSVVLSGDTRVSENLVRHARGADVLVHEAIDPEALRSWPGRPRAETVEAIIALHVTPQQAGDLFPPHRAPPRGVLPRPGQRANARRDTQGLWWRAPGCRGPADDSDRLGDPGSALHAAATSVTSRGWDPQAEEQKPRAAVRAALTVTG